MTSPEFHDRLARHLEGTLPEAEAEGLWREILSDERARAEFIAGQELHHDLRRLLSQGADDRAFARGILNALSAGRKDSATFAHDVAARAAPRRAGLALRARRPSGSWILWTAAAAAILLVLGLVLSRPAPGPRPVAQERPKAPPPVPPAPAPVSAPAPLPEKPAPAPAPEPPRPAPAPAPAPRPEPDPPALPKPEPPKPPPLAPLAPKAPETVTAVARVEAAEGEVVSGGAALAAGSSVFKGQGVATVGKARAILAFTDKTKLELGGETLLSEISEAEGSGKERRGKRVVVAKGVVSAEVDKQPQDQPMIFSTPHAEAKVLGTTLRIVVDGGFTRLEVTEGRVRLTRRTDNAYLDVGAGHYAVVMKGLALAAKPLNLLASPGFESGLQAWQVKKSTARVGLGTARARTGSRSLEIAGDGQAFGQVFQAVRVVPGQAYEASVWIWKGAGFGGGASFTWVDAAGKTVGGDTDLPVPPAAPGWARHAGRYVAPPNAVAAKLELYCRDAASSFDDATVVESIP